MSISVHLWWTLIVTYQRPLQVDANSHSKNFFFLKKKKKLRLSASIIVDATSD
jgi:hypothetical protein